MCIEIRRAKVMLWPQRTAAAALIAVCAAVWSAPVSADPPPWAPAWGHRVKHKNKIKHKNKGGYVTQQAYAPPFDIGLGRCNRDLIGGLLGAAAGGLIGSRIGDGDGRAAATAGGTLLGFLIGREIGSSMDAVDRSCLAQSLEYAEDGRKITWNDPESGARYQVVPTKTAAVGDGRYCREYTATVTLGGKVETVYGKACRQPDGGWRIQN